MFVMKNLFVVSLLTCVACGSQQNQSVNEETYIDVVVSEDKSEDASMNYTTMTCEEPPAICTPQEQKLVCAEE